MLVSTMDTHALQMVVVVKATHGQVITIQQSLLAHLITH